MQMTKGPVMVFGTMRVVLYFNIWNVIPTVSPLWSTKKGTSGWWEIHDVCLHKQTTHRHAAPTATGKGFQPEGLQTLWSAGLLCGSGTESHLGPGLGTADRRGVSAGPLKVYNAALTLYSSHTVQQVLVGGSDPEPSIWEPNTLSSSTQPSCNNSCA